ncbi:type II toxin-antitoxin system HicB family antitoxin [Emergencia timonensis]|uniref:Type II toxin-antitoxin system HicB family antitoxin n=1 Tax=Emergencia timonensis TaxID=1776384 RepID=A0A415E6W1_9FIRM|nr:type II toxin-antitoxin system HicB family antitoxin [Emergencia timonensis]
MVSKRFYLSRTKKILNDFGYQEFHKAVDEYLETCESLGRQPEKAFKGQFNVRIDPALHKELAYHAVRDNCSLNQYVENALRKAVEKEEDR